MKAADIRVGETYWLCTGRDWTYDRSGYPAEVLWVGRATTFSAPSRMGEPVTIDGHTYDMHYETVTVPGDHPHSLAIVRALGGTIPGSIITVPLATIRAPEADARAAIAAALAPYDDPEGTRSTNTRDAAETDRAARQAELNHLRDTEQAQAEAAAAHIRAEIARGNTPTRAYRDWSSWHPEKPSYTSPTGLPTPKWRGISLTHIHTGYAAVDTARQKVLALEWAVTAARREQEAAEEALRIEVSALMRQPVLLGRSACAESPTKLHLYSEDDPSLWDCLICGEPDGTPK